MPTLMIRKNTPGHGQGFGASGGGARLGTPSALADIQTGAQVRHRHERLSRLARKELTYPSEWIMPQAQMRHSQLSDGCSQGKPQC
jgi:hypothetical protein